MGRRNNSFHRLISIYLFWIDAEDNPIPRHWEKELCWISCRLRDGAVENRVTHFIECVLPNLNWTDKRLTSGAWLHGKAQKWKQQLPFPTNYSNDLIVFHLFGIEFFFVCVCVCALTLGRIVQVTIHRGLEDPPPRFFFFFFFFFTSAKDSDGILSILCDCLTVDLLLFSVMVFKWCHVSICISR